MAYKDLRKIFHENQSQYETEYRKRFEGETTIHIDIDINGSPAFLTVTPELYEASLKAAKLDKEILTHLSYLPSEAVESYMDLCLIEEIVITNGIEGVRSTRKEIGEVLDGLRERDRDGRFHGLVRKYLMLSGGQDIPLATCQDVRKLYDELVLDEVIAENPKDAPDGSVFRKGPVSVVNPSQVEVHRGIEPEKKLIEAMSKALELLGSEEVLPLARISAFHFLFGYAHPFYNGNGRMNRFISSYMLSNEYESIVGLRLSYSIKSSINRYYKAFEACEHKLNRGDMTPFVQAFSKMIVSAMEDTRDSLRDRQQTLQKCTVLIKRLADSIRGKDIYEISAQIVATTLYSPYGTTVSELGEMFGLSRQTVYERLKPLKNSSLLVYEKIGRKTYIRMDIERLSNLFGREKSDATERDA